MNNHGMNVCELINELKGISDDSVLHSISTVDETDYSILAHLDEARKSFDVILGRAAEESVSIQEAKVKRILYNTLRKYSMPLNLESREDCINFGDIVKLNNMSNDTVRVLATHLKGGLLPKVLQANAVNGFLHRNASVQRHVPKHLREHMKKFLAAALSGFDDVFTSSPGAFGTGAVAEGISFFERWDQLGETPYWDASLEDLSPVENQSIGEVRLCAVDKDWNKKRLITVEPYESTYLQHKIRRALSRTLVQNGLGKLASQADSHIDIPAVHRRVCLESSAHTGQTIKMDSIDLSDASDSISWDQIVSVFPVDVSAQLERARTVELTTRVSSFDIREWGDLNRWDGDPISFDADKTAQLLRYLQSTTAVTAPLNIYAGMGNATTFIVETLYFYALLQAVATYYRIPTRESRAISVFGDDMLTPSGWDHLFLVSLEEAGLKVNLDKTFVGASPVRESCGMWAYKGVNLYVPPYRGYPETAKGQLGLAEYIRNAPFLMEDLCLPRVKDWPNTPRKLANTISVVDTARCVDWERSRYSSKLCGRQWFLKTAVVDHRFHLSVRRGGAYLMISRVPSQEGLSEVRPLIEVLNSYSKNMRSLVLDSYLDLDQHTVKGSSRKGKIQNPLYWYPNGPSQHGCVQVSEHLFAVADHVMALASHFRGKSWAKAIRNIRAWLRKPPKGAPQAMHDYMDELGQLCEDGGIHAHLKLLSLRVHVLKEAIPYSVRLRSSWVSDT